MNRDSITICGKEFVYDSRTGTHRPAEAVNHNRTADLPADVEPRPGDESVGEKSALPFNTPVRIEIISHRSRLCDTDGVSHKACIDGLVHCGVLRDDSPAEVAEVSYRQVKVKNRQDEKTEIVITEV